MPAALHMQQQILNAVASVLAAGSTVASTRVYVDHTDPLPDSGLPAILIEEADDGESIQPYTVHGHQQRELKVQVRCVTRVSPNQAAEARAFGLEVEKLLAASSTLAALCKLGVQITASRLQADAQGEHPYAARIQTWLLSYLVLSTTPDAAA